MNRVVWACLCTSLTLSCSLASPPSLRAEPRDAPAAADAKPLTAVYEVVIPIENDDLKLQPGLRGFAKIDGGIHTLGWWLWRLVTKTFHFNL